MVKKTLKNKKLKGGSDFGPATYNASTTNPYTTYDLNVEPDPSREMISSRNIVGGKKRRKSKSKRKTKGNNKRKSKKRGGMYSLMPQLYNDNNPALI